MAIPAINPNFLSLTGPSAVGRGTPSGGIPAEGSGGGKSPQPEKGGYAGYTGIVNSDLSNLAVTHNGKSGVANTICIA